MKIPSRILSAIEKTIAPTLEGLIVLDSEGQCVLWNRAMERMTGLSADDVVGTLGRETFPFLPELGESNQISQVLSGKNLVLKDITFSIPDNDRGGTFDAFHAPLVGEDGSICGVTIIVRETTQARQTEQDLKETEARFRKMADHAPVNLWMSGTDSLCNFFNQTWLDFTGRTMDQELGVGWASGVHPEDFQYCMDTYVAAFNRREAFTMEYRLRRHDGEYRWILDRGIPRFSPQGEFSGYIGSCTDITEQKNAEFELKTAVRMRDEFLSVASHEFRTPMTSLKLQLQILRQIVSSVDAATHPQKVAKIMDHSEMQLNRLVELVQNLLDVSRIGARQLEIIPQPTDLQALVKTAVDRLSLEVADSGSQIIIEESEPIWGEWDPSRLEQIIANFLTNAVKYGNKKPVVVRVYQNQGRAQISVRDQGIGIQIENKNRIFERFYRAVSAEHYGGLGLGLYIANEIARAHGGTITVESEPGKGSEFTLSLPL